MIYQFDYCGRMVASHESYLAAAEWIKGHTDKLLSANAGAKIIAFYVQLNDDLQCLRYPCFGFWFSEYSFLGDL